jgi:hypothetical protein
MSEKEFSKVMGYVSVHLVLQTRLVTMNGGNLLPMSLSSWLHELANNACQQTAITVMDGITDELKKALLLSKPVGEQVSCVFCCKSCL